MPADMPIEQAKSDRALWMFFPLCRSCTDQDNGLCCTVWRGTLGLGMVGAIKQANPKCLVVLDMNDDRLAKAKRVQEQTSL